MVDDQPILVKAGLVVGALVHNADLVPAWGDHIGLYEFSQRHGRPAFLQRGAAPGFTAPAHACNSSMCLSVTILSSV